VQRHNIMGTKCDHDVGTDLLGISKTAEALANIDWLN
jgi:hypothetical protein